MKDERLSLAACLRERAEEVSRLAMVSGFDGFVDQLAQVVEERVSLEVYEPVETISRFGELIAGAAGRSSLREFVVLGLEAGGCAVNLGDGAASLGVQLDYFGTVGNPVHGAFGAFAEKCRRFRTLGCEPGFTMALEFADGKTMFSSVSQLGGFTAGALREAVADGEFLAACGEAGLIALTNWTLYPHMTDCWRLVQEEVLSQVGHRPWVFLDLVDPRSRKLSDLEALLPVISGFERSARCILGGNLNEANVLAGLLGVAPVPEEGPAVADLCAELRAALGVSEVAIHCVAGAAVASEAEAPVWVAGPYTAKPKKSTGAGDRYNAGYCVGRMLDLPAAWRCLLGTATSGFFVREARSGSLAEVSGLLEAWAEGRLGA